MKQTWNRQILQWIRITYGDIFFPAVCFCGFAFGNGLRSPFCGMLLMGILFLLFDSWKGKMNKTPEITAFLPFDQNEYGRYVEKKAGIMTAMKAGGMLFAGAACTLYLAVARKEMIFHFWYGFIFTGIVVLIFLMQSYIRMFVSENAGYRKIEKKYFCKQCLTKATKWLYVIAKELFVLLLIYALPITVLIGNSENSVWGENTIKVMRENLLVEMIILIINGVSFVKCRKSMLEVTGMGDYNAKDGGQ